MFGDDADISDLMFDPGPKHSTPLKERPDSSEGRKDSPVQPTGLQKCCSPQASKTPVSLQASSESQPWLNLGPVTSGSHVQSIISQMSQRGGLQAVVAQQRKEIALLVQELRDRDQELNELVRSHQQQLCVWEQDRQLIMRLQHKYQCLAAEVKQQKGEHSGGQWCASESWRQQAESAVLSSGTDHSSLCSQEKSLAEAQEVCEELRAQVKSLQLQKEQWQSHTEQLLKVWQWRCHSLQEDKNKLIDACQEKDRQLEKATVQLQDTIQQALVLQQALVISCEEEKNKDEVLASLKSRQERLCLELSQMRALYKHQNREMTLLQLTLNTSKESDREQTDAGLTIGTTKHAVSTYDSTNLMGLTSSVSTGHKSRTMCEDIYARSLQHSQSAPQCADSVDCTDSSKEKSRKLHSICCHGATDDHRSSNADNRCQRTSDGPTADVVHNRHGTGFQDPSVNNCRSFNNLSENAFVNKQGIDLDYCQQALHPTNNCCVNNNCSNLSGEHFHSPNFHSHYQKKSASSACAEQGSTSQGSDQSVSVSPVDSDDINPVQDVDTEAFWQKILSVRHGNQNSIEETKDLMQLSVKPEVRVVTNVASHSTTDCTADEVRRSRHGGLRRYKSSPVLVSKGSADSTNMDTVMAVSSDKEKGKETALQVSPRSELTTQNHWEQGPASQRGLPNQQRTLVTLLQEVSVVSSKDVSPACSQSRKSPTQNSSTLKKSDQHDFQQKPPRVPVAQGVHLPLHSSADPEAAMAPSTSFDEKLSSFLESPEDNTSWDAAGSEVGNSSPASKLHRLLLESQAMLQSLEVKTHLDH